MIKTLKFISAVVVTAVSLSAVFGFQSAFAQGEKWELVDKTTIKVSGGLFTGPVITENGQTSNPKSITLKPRSGDGTGNPSIWIATTSFYLSSSTGNLIERRANDQKPRNKGEFCVEIHNAINLVKSRETVTASPIHREDCNQKDSNAIRIITPAPAADLPQCAVGGLFGGKWNCNALWGNGSTDKADVGLTGKIKIAYAIPGDPLKCGDPGFVGDCPVPYDPRTADCNRTNGQPGESQKCEAIKECIVDAGKTQAECEGAWTGCVTSYPDDNINYNSCKTAISKGDLEGGRHVDTTKLEDLETCKIDGIGWIICPVMDFMAKIVDGAYSIVDTLLTTPNINTDASDPANGMYKAWEIMRTIANAAFVVAFLIIIFSQLTSVGITNYGIKKMLPRLIISAILVNVSYFLCAIAVDVSNILGSSAKQLFDSVGGQLAGPAFAGGPSQTGDGWAGTVGLALAGTGVAIGVLYAQISILLPALIAAIAAIVTVFLVLTLRQALIIILIVISPFAFVAFLLPNTEDLFNKWRKLLITLLLMFPIIAGIFGASSLASKVIMSSDNASFAVQVMGALVAIIPLFITPIVMKTAGGVLNRFGGVINNPNKGPFDRMRKGAEGYRNNRKEYRNLKALNGYRTLPGMGRTAKLKSSRQAVLNNRKNELNRANAEYVSERAGADTNAGRRFANQLSQGSGEKGTDRALAAALNVKLKLSAEEVENEVKRIIETGDPVTMKQDVQATFIKATNEGDTVKALAAQRILATKLGAPGVELYQEGISAIEAGGRGNADTITELRRSSGELALKGKDNASAAWGYSGKDMATIKASAGTYTGLNAVELASQNLKSLEDAEANISQDQAIALLANDNATQALDEQKRRFFVAKSTGGPVPIRPRDPLTNKVL